MSWKPMHLVSNFKGFSVFLLLILLEIIDFIVFIAIYSQFSCKKHSNCSLNWKQSESIDFNAKTHDFSTSSRPHIVSNFQS